MATRHITTNLIDALEIAKSNKTATVELVHGNFMSGWEMWIWLQGEWHFSHAVYGSIGRKMSDRDFESMMINLVESQTEFGEKRMLRVYWNSADYRDTFYGLITEIC